MKYGETVFRNDWYGEVLVDPVTGKTTVLPSRHHRMCGTCVGELDRHAAKFESEFARKLLGSVTRIPEAQQIAHADHLEFCCICGAKSLTEAIFEMSPNSQVCDGMHEKTEDDS